MQEEGVAPMATFEWVTRFPGRKAGETEWQERRGAKTDFLFKAPNLMEVSKYI